MSHLYNPDNQEANLDRAISHLTVARETMSPIAMDCALEILHGMQRDLPRQLSRVLAAPDRLYTDLSEPESDPLYGIIFRGDGEEVQAGDEEGIYDDDMEAAYVVARNGHPYLLFEQYTAEDGRVEPWKVIAFSDLDDALSETVDIDDYDLATGGKSWYFVFDGRSHRAVASPNGAGYTCALSRAIW